MEVNKTIELKTTAKAIEFSANKPTSVSSEFSSNTLTVNYFEQGKKKSTEIVLKSSALVSFIFNPTTNNFDLGTDEPEGDYSYIPIGYAYVSDGAITKFIPFGDVDYSSEIDEEKTARESADELLQANKVDKVTGKGLSTNDFTNEYKSKIETNEYNDIFNIRVEWDRQYMPNAELIAISFQEYENGILADDVVKDDVKDITNGDVYLYKNTSDQWAMAVGTPPSSYHRLPMLIGNIATKTVNGESVKLFFRNGDDETQFDELNNEKVDKVSGKGLSTNDFTNEYKNKVDNIAEENYVLIKDFTVETETPDVTFTTDSDETTALNLKSARIYIEIPPTSSSGIVRIQLKKTLSSPAIVYTYEGNGISASTRVRHLLETYQNKGFWQTVYSMNGTARGMLPDYMNVAVDNTLDYIGRIQISSTTSGLNFPVNTKIKVWGVRV